MSSHDPTFSQNRPVMRALVRFWRSDKGLSIFSALLLILVFVLPPFLESVTEFLRTIDCYVMGSRTYETALRFEAKGFGWPYGETPTFVLTHREWPKVRPTVEFYAGDLRRLVEERLKPMFHLIWFVGGGAVSGECLRRRLADELRYSILPVLIGDGIPFFERLEGDVALHLLEVKGYQSGMVALRYEVKRQVAASDGAERASAT